MATNKRTIKDIQAAIELGKEIDWGPALGKEIWEDEMTIKKEAKLYTAAEMEEAQAAAFIDGMVAVHSVTFDALGELRSSIDNVQAVFYLGDVRGTRTALTDQLQLAWDTLTHLEDVIEDKYDAAMSEKKAILRTREYAEIRESLGLD